MTQQEHSKRLDLFRDRVYRFSNQLHVRAIYFTIYTMLLAGNILFTTDTSDFSLFTLLGVYILMQYIFHLEAKITFLYALFVLGLMYIGFIYQGSNHNSERAAVFLFFFLLIGIFHRLRE